MKKKLAELLFKWAVALNPEIATKRKLAIGYKITTADIKKYRKLHDCSQRDAVKELLKQSKGMVGASIIKGLERHKMITYTYSNNPLLKAVKGELVIYAPKE